MLHRQNRHRPIDIYELPEGPAHTVVEGGPVGPEVIEPLELLVLDPPVRPESSLGDGLVERISDSEPAARQVQDTTLDS